MKYIVMEVLLNGNTLHKNNSNKTHMDVVQQHNRKAKPRHLCLSMDVLIHPDQLSLLFLSRHHALFNLSHEGN